jgi:hypothetical protein
MSRPRPSSPRVVAIGASAAGALLWRSHEQLQLTVVAQARLSICHEAAMELVEPGALTARDEHRNGDPSRSLVRAADLVPYRPRCDVWMTGHACAPGGRAVSVALVRLALYRASSPLIDRTIHVLGDRATPEAPPDFFTRMPLTYERAFGGIGFDANPVGVGADERPLAPNLVDPHEPGRPAAFGPVSRYWRQRRQHVSPELRRALDAPVPVFPAGFVWDYFQAAPLNQQVGFLEGDEWLVLDGTSPTLLRVQSRLPKLACAARIRLPGGDEEGDTIVMVADGLAIDADAQTVTVTWRGYVSIGDRATVEELRLAAGVVRAGETPDWGRLLASGAWPSPRLAGPLRPAIRLDATETTIVSERDAAAPDRAPATDDREHTERSRVAPPRYPRAERDPEQSDTLTSLRLGVTEPGSSHPLPGADTEPGMLVSVGEDSGWAEESQRGDRVREDGPATLPDVAPRPLPPRPPPPPRRVTISGSPAPFDRLGFVAALRRAGASEADIRAALDALGDER